MSLRIILIWLVSCIAVPCFAHKDAILTWKADGTVEGLPAEFQPAVLLVSFDRAEGNLRRIGSLTLRIAGQTVKLPRCITDPIRVPDRAAVRILGSWYHDLSMGPPYIYIEFYSSDPRSTSPKNSQSLHFNLRTAHLMAVETEHYAANESVISHSKVAFRSHCPEEDLASFSEPFEEHQPNKSLERTRE